ncbi:MAG: hypothetical protein ACOC04_06670, partial [Halothece sp.]
DLRKEIIEEINHETPSLDVTVELKPNQQGKIGQTWLIMGKLAGNLPASQQVAQACYQLFAVPDSVHKTNVERGNLLGGELFEFCQHSDVGNENHLLVWLFPLEQTSLKDVAQSVYVDLIKLLGDRHQIQKTYQESLQVKRELQTRYELAQLAIKEFTNKINIRSYNSYLFRDSLSDNLHKLADYTNRLNKMKSQINLLNKKIISYENKLQEIERNYPDSDLANFHKFLNEAKNRDLPEIQESYDYLTSGLKLWENVTQTIEALLQIENTKSGRELQVTMATATSGLAVSTVSAIVGASLKPKNENLVGLYGTLTSTSLILGAIASYIVWKVSHR